MTQTAGNSRALRIELIVPINNTTMERELTAWLPAGSTCQTLKIPRGKALLTREAVPAYTETALALTAELATSLDVIVYGCTAAAFLAGAAADGELVSRIQAMRGIATISTATSMVRTLSRLGATTIGLVSPYSEAVNAGLTSYLAAGHIRVARFSGFYAADVDALERITEQEIVEHTRKVAGPECAAVFIACSQLPTYNVVDRLSAEFGKPVLSSVRATALQILSMFENHLVAQ